MKEEVIEFSVAEVREEVRLLHKGICQINWCRTHTDLTPEEVTQTKTPTLEHIIPKKLGGSDHLYNLTYTVEYCNSKKGHTISDTDLIQGLLTEAKRNELPVLKKLLKKRISLTGKNKGYYVVKILTVIYEIKITKKGNVCILNNKVLADQEKEQTKIQNRYFHTSP